MFENFQHPIRMLKPIIAKIHGTESLILLGLAKRLLSRSHSPERPPIKRHAKYLHNLLNIE